MPLCSIRRDSGIIIGTIIDWIPFFKKEMSKVDKVFKDSCQS
jgi:hypothetical protein